MSALPPGAKAYKQTEVFDEETVPAGLLREHRTKAGVWARIHVVSGRLAFRVQSSGEALELQAGESVVVEPEAVHEVAPLGAVRFFVEFLRVS